MSKEIIFLTLRMGLHGNIGFDFSPFFYYEFPLSDEFNAHT